MLAARHLARSSAPGCCEFDRLGAIPVQVRKEIAKGTRRKLAGRSLIAPSLFR